MTYDSTAEYPEFMSVGDETNTAVYAMLRTRALRWSELRDRLETDDALEIATDVFNAHIVSDQLDTALEDARSHIATLQASGITTATITSLAYPPQLRTIHDAPGVVYMRGQSLDSDLKSVAIVGTRTPSPQAVAFTAALAGLLADEETPVVSGLARGIDTVAQQASLDRGNRTVAVIGTGLDVHYPPENRELQDVIGREHLLLSQFDMGVAPARRHFPMRNVVMSGLSSLTVIVEAGEHSGTRTQARAAVKHSRPLVLTQAVYQQTQWAQELVAQGQDITLVRTADEAIDAIHGIRARGSVPLPRLQAL